MITSKYNNINNNSNKNINNNGNNDDNVSFLMIHCKFFNGSSDNGRISNSKFAFIQLNFFVALQIMITIFA